MATMTKKAISPIIDEYGLVSLLIRRLTKRRQELISSLKLINTDPTRPLTTPRFCINYSSTNVEYLDHEAIENKMGEGWLKQFKKNGTREEYKITSLDGIDAKLKSREIDLEVLCEIFKELEISQ